MRHWKPALWTTLGAAIRRTAVAKFDLPDTPPSAFVSQTPTCPR